jgi:hypothetical protein
VNEIKQVDIPRQSLSITHNFSTHGRVEGPSFMSDSRPEHFRFTSLHQESMEGGFFLRKKPLRCVDSINSRIENAVVAPT